MANFTLDQLLKYPPYDAVLIAYNDVHGTQLNPRYVVLDKVLSSEGPVATIRLKARTVLPNAEENRFSGSGDISVTRLDLSKVFTTPIKLKYFTEVASRDVANTITAQTGIIFDESDFVAEVLTPTNSILKASPNSLRWYGQISVIQA